MRDGFIFYRSFYESAKALNDTDKLALYEAIFELALNQTETKQEPMVNAFLNLIKPQIEANNRRFENGKKGGRPTQNKDDSKPNNNQTITKAKPKEKEKEKDKDKDTSVTAKASKYVYISQLQDEGIIQTERGVSLAEDFIKYRAQIKKPIKTIQPLKAYIKVLGELITKKMDIDKAIELMKEKEWQTLKAEYLPKDFGSEVAEKKQEFSYNQNGQIVTPSSIFDHYNKGNK